MWGSFDVFFGKRLRGAVAMAKRKAGSYALL